MLIKYMIIKIHVKIPLNSKTQRLLLLIHWPKLFWIFFFIYKLNSACFS